MTTPVIVPIELQLTPRSRAVMESLARLLPPSFVAAEPEAEASAAPSGTPPSIGQPWPGIDGVYVGVSRGEDGEPDAHLVLLNAQPDKAMDWKAAMAWARAQGDGARAPTRRESALIYANTPSMVRTDVWHWTSTQYSAYYAWSQAFGLGTQYDFSLGYESWCRPVRRLALQSFNPSH